MNFNQLRYFCAVCQCMNITKASRSLFVSQAAVSVAIQKLEEDFGVKLLLRNNNQLTLTREGEVFYRRAQELLESADRFAADMGALKGRATQIRIAVPPLIGIYVMPRFADLEQYISAYVPLYQISLRETEVSQLLPELSEGRVEAVVACDRTADFSACHALELFHLPFYALVRRDHPLAALPAVSPQQLREYPLIRAKGVSMTGIVREWFRNANCPVEISAAYSQMSTVQTMLLRGEGVCVANDSMNLSHPQLVEVPLIDPIYAKVFIFWMKGKAVSAQDVEFFRFLSTLPFGKSE